MMNLTAKHNAAILMTHCNSSVGRENPFTIGDKTPQLFKAVFLCPQFLAFNILLSVIHYGGLFGRSFRAVAPIGDILTPLQPATHDVRIMSGLPTIQTIGIKQ
jgi:hypothetical protein